MAGVGGGCGRGGEKVGWFISVAAGAGPEAVVGGVVCVLVLSALGCDLGPWTVVLQGMVKIWLL